MNIFSNIIITIFSSPIYSAIVFMTVFTAIFGYIGLTAKIVDKPRVKKSK